VIRRRLTFSGVRRRYADRKAELPLIAAYSDVAARASRRLDGQEDTGDESDCTGGGDLRFFYDCKRPLQCYQVDPTDLFTRRDSRLGPGWGRPPVFSQPPPQFGLLKIMTVPLCFPRTNFV